MSFRLLLLVVAIAGCQLDDERPLEDERHDRSAETGEQADEAWHAAEGVTQLDDTHFQITRALWLSLPTLAETEPGIRVIPTSLDGRLYGGKLFVITAGSLPERVGFRNGDVVRAINGQLVLNPEDVFNAYYEAFDASSIAVEILRDGREQTLHYEID